jgi:hypothetical protein
MSKNLKSFFLTGKADEMKSKVKISKKKKFKSGKNSTFNED